MLLKVSFSAVRCLRCILLNFNYFLPLPSTNQLCCYLVTLSKVSSQLLNSYQNKTNVEHFIQGSSFLKLFREHSILEKTFREQNSVKFNSIEEKTKREIW